MKSDSINTLLKELQVEIAKVSVLELERDLGLKFQDLALFGPSQRKKLG